MFTEECMHSCKRAYACVLLALIFVLAYVEMCQLESLVLKTFLNMCLGSLASEETKKRLVFTYHGSCVLLDNLLMCHTSEPLSHDYNNIAFWPKLQKLEFWSKIPGVKLLGPYGYTLTIGLE